MEYKHLKTGSSMISWRASARKRVFSVSLRFAPFISPVFMGWGKRQIPLISPWLASVNFTKFRIPPPLSFELKTMSRIFPCPGAEKPIHPLVFPDIFPWLARGPTPGASRWHVHYREPIYKDPDSDQSQQMRMAVTSKLLQCALPVSTSNGEDS